MISKNRYDLLMRLVDDNSIQAKPALPDMDHQPARWESSMQAICECLSWCGTLDHLDRRHAEDELGETVYAQFPIHARSALVTAHTLLDRGEISEEELEARMKQVRSRFASA